MSKTRNIISRGFSLSELLIAVTLLGVLTSIAVPSYVNHLRRTCQYDLASRLSLLAGSVTTHNDDSGSPPTTWAELNAVSAVMTEAGPANASDGDLTNAIRTQGCDYTLRRLSSTVPEEFIFIATPITNNGDAAEFNVVSCLDASNGASDVKMGRKDTTGAASETDLTCWR